MTSASIPGEWDEVLQRVSRAKGHVLVVGPVDCGKTTFTTLLASSQASTAGSAVVIDADLGQTEIGPPACVTVGSFSSDMSALSQASVLHSAFVGAVSPSGVTSMLIGALCQCMAATSDVRLIVDTGGYAMRQDAWEQIISIAAVVQPSDIVLLQRSHEVAPLERMLRLLPGVTLHVPPLAAGLQIKSREYRSQRRRIKFSAALTPSSLLEFDFWSTPVLPTWLGTGKTLPTHLYSYVKQVLAPSVKVYHAEQWGDQLGLLVNVEPTPSAPALHAIRSATKAVDVHCIPAPSLKNRLVGLVAQSRSLLALGIVEKLDCRRGIVGIRTPIRTPLSVAAIQLGRLNMRADGTEIK